MGPSHLDKEFSVTAGLVMVRWELSRVITATVFCPRLGPWSPAFPSMVDKQLCGLMVLAVLSVLGSEKER